MLVIYKDLRGFIKQVDELGALRRVNGADPKFELGGITEVAAGTPECPALLFDRIKGHAPGFRVFTNATTTPQRAALALGIDPSLKPLDALKAWMQKRQKLDAAQAGRGGESAVHGKLHARAECRSDASCRRPTGTARTAGRSSARARSSSCATPTAAGSTPRSIACRCTARTRVTIQFDHPGRHGAIIAKKYWDKGKSCPVAVVNGEDPALFIAGFEYLPDGQSEYDFAGAIKGAPIEVMPGPVTGLPLPAQAEIILEGELLPPSKLTLPEGPFGEFTGYYAADARPCPVMQVSAIHHRDDPILLGSPPMKPPRFHFGLPFRAASIWSNLETVGVTDVVGVWQHVAQLMTVVALKQRYAGHAKRAGADRRRQQLHGPPGRGGGRRRRSLQPRRRDVGDHHALRAGRADRHRAQRLELGARSAHPRRGTSAPASPRTPRRSSRRCGRSAGRTNTRRPRRSPPTKPARSR